MTANEIIARLFYLSHALRGKASTMVNDAERTHDEFIIAIVLEFIANEIDTAFCDVIECEGEA